MNAEDARRAEYVQSTVRRLMATLGDHRSDLPEDDRLYGDVTALATCLAMTSLLQRRVMPTHERTRRIFVAAWEAIETAIGREAEIN
jgi:hypothetical protein